MSKYFMDCEFLEGAQKENFPISLFRKNTPPTIDLISIGIVADDGREYYAISKDFNLKEAWNRFDIKTSVTYTGKGTLSIGCHNYTIEKWIEKFEVIGKKENYTDAEISEYKIYIDLAKMFHENVYGNE